MQSAIYSPDCIRATKLERIGGHHTGSGRRAKRLIGTLTLRDSTTVRES